MRDLFRAVNDDPNIKLIVVHGGKFFSAGNDLAALSSHIGGDPEDLKRMANEVTSNL
jgi:enoyl-CoA hydratase/carnithine racemase